MLGVMMMQRGRGRGAGINIPAWMASGDGPRAAQAAAGAEAEAALGAATREAEEVAQALSGPRPHPDNWESMTKDQRESWRSNAKRAARRKGAGHEGT